MTKTAIKVGQIWRQKGATYQLIVSGKKGGKWHCKVLTEKPGVFGGSHKMSQITLWRKFELLP